MNKNFEYDVALSFAGEDRQYVEQVAEKLRANKISVFYDKYEESRLWGRNLYIHLQNVYQNLSRFTVIFISEHYAKKNWTSHEMQSAQARAIKENYEYILPARFDSTIIPGLLETIGYINLQNTKPHELAELIMNKLREESIKTKKEDLEDKTSKIEISREKSWSGSGNEFFIYLNGEIIGAIDSGEVQEFSVSPGENSVRLGYRYSRENQRTGSIYTLSGSTETIKIPFQAGKKYKCKCGYEPENFLKTLGQWITGSDEIHKSKLYFHIENIVSF